MHHHFGLAGNARIIPNTKFPIKIHSSGRYLADNSGNPLLLHGDTPWSIVVQFTQAQIVSYLDQRLAQGFNAIQFNAIEHHFSDQSPAYRTVEGYDPFTTMTDFASTPVANYWNKVDFVINQALARGMVCLVNFAYWGYLGGSEGWWSEINAETNADLQTYGAFLANRYTQPNIIWCMGGDWGGDNSTNRNKQWNIVTGMRTVRTDQLITAHNSRSDSDAYSTWGPSYPGFNLNAVYTDNEVATESAVAHARSGPIPYFFIEGVYEQTSVFSGDAARDQAWRAIFSGNTGHFYGQTPLWAGGATIVSGGAGAAATLANDINVVGANTLAHLASWMNANPWIANCVPKTDTSLITTSLWSGSGRTCPMLRNDNAAAAIFFNYNSGFTVNMAALTGITGNAVRARWYDCSNGTYTLVSGSPFSNTGTRAFTYPGTNSRGVVDWLLVLDQG